VAFKQKIPVLAGAAVLSGGILALVFLAARPPDEDRLLAAARVHAAGLGRVRDVQVHPPVADVVLEPDGRCLFLEFVRRGGDWVFHRDLGRDFTEMMGRPEQEREVLNRLGQRLADRLRVPVTLKEGLRVEIEVFRDERGLAGRYGVGFAFPAGSEGRNPQRGRYLETYRYRDGAWILEGLGRLLIEIPGRGTLE